MLLFRYFVKCIQEVTKNDSFSFKTFFLMLYPTQGRYYSGGLQKIKTQTIFSKSSHSSCGKEVDGSLRKYLLAFFFNQHVKISSY